MFVLKENVTAAELGVDSCDVYEGYRSWDVIGDAGTPIEIVADALFADDCYTGMIEVTGFNRDPFVFAYIHKSMIQEV